MFDRLLGTVRGLKRRKRTIQVCPRCKAQTLRRSSQFDGWIFPDKFICNKCGYVGPLSVEVELPES